ncbi:hypothetical protein CLAFUW4_09084 [Fulvia fulva]|uniref:Uncharacterized protein n=1 Tax=Passalora fulva TaxID=5499 RepID=A0A9Q8PGX4_PASFU|nr:uncharacterized protein CLAFUR5_09193 [Fulvia fulva]KAK4614161.1 hypothetical protein CLAFUR4_09090 [Fulvia fulva]KAK4614267.1 hypothetical protein CLAFUR0_09082 [Fulvia fulva]UJO22320.1 hypothetical protein CLAFUR5_09193 [Fulvia fulva]WPV20261.1 hypothetical protein CLAFUW4_09084 [Fulvia fulva]WPV35368.1 hypothetical protein CLAFUW7_09085 [Fulvia fulva]
MSSGSKRTKHTWTAAERHVMHIAHDEFKLPWDSIAAIFGHLFSTNENWSGLCMPSQGRLKDEYNSRGYDQRSTMFANESSKSEVWHLP